MSARVWLNNHWVCLYEYQLLELVLDKFPDEIQRIIRSLYSDYYQ